jgi:hypothetical protein
MSDSQFTSALRRAARILAITLVAATAACTSLTPTARTPRTPADTAVLEERARAAEEAGNAAAAADLYTQLAATAAGSRRVEFLLAAARLAADYGDSALARRRLNEARTGATPVQLQTSAVLLARLELAEGRAQAALDMLAALPPLSEAAQSDAAAVRGQALFRVGRPVEAVRALVEREVWLTDAPAILANQRMIWDGFRQRPLVSPAPTGDVIVDGWLALAPLVTSAGADLRRALLGWRQTYTTHPAAAGLLADLLASQRDAAFPRQIALLLPLSSPQVRTEANAIRDGFLAAHLRATGNSATTVRVYDSARGSGAAYLQAQLDGAEFIVGPLLRPEVDEVIGGAGFVPTLALNFAQTSTPFLSSFHQFSLAPEDEVATVAAAAVAGGAKTAIAFVPSDQRNQEIGSSFKAAFEQAGGQLLASYPYERALLDFSVPVATLLNVTSSRERHRRLTANLGIPVQFEARRRDDVDMIFVLADARTARLLSAQLRFFGASDIPTYAISQVFDAARSARDNELNDFIFADVPALIAPDDAAAEVRAELETYWPQRDANLLRLYAMGFDAYRLVGPLFTEDQAAWPMRGLSGDLSLDAQGRVRRVLPLAQFRNGHPVAYDVVPAEPSSLIGQR